MAVRLEWTEARYAKPTVYARGAVLGDGGRVRHQAALVFGTEVIEGDVLDLIELCTDAVAALVSVPDRATPSTRGT